MGKTLLFGGSFDPPHLGHMNLLQHAIRAVAPDKVLVIPAGLPPHKHPGAAPGPLRLAMCRCFCPLHPALTVSDMELTRPGKSYTYTTLSALRKAAVADTFFLTLGSDMLSGFTEWYRWRELLVMATLVAGGRRKAAGPKAAGQPSLQAAAEVLRQAGGRVIWASGPVLPASSSAIRAAIAAGGEPAEREGYALIPAPASAIVREHRLYRAAATEKGDE